MEEKTDKEIVFIWFGDNEPSYAEWSVENFKTMNPSWNVKYIKYSTDQILNHHKELNDQILEKTIKCFNIEIDKYHYSGDITAWKNKLTMTHMVEIYRYIYLSQNKKSHDLIVYLDLDCFPIAPLDDFFAITSQNNEIASFDTKMPRNAGIWIYRCQSMAMKQTYIENKDGWFLYCSNKCIGIKQNFHQIVKIAQLDKPLGYSKDTWQFIFNVGDRDQIARIQQYRQRFLDKKLWLGESLCNPFFTPVEHMQISERYKSNAYIIRKKIKQ